MPLFEIGTEQSKGPEQTGPLPAVVRRWQAADRQVAEAQYPALAAVEADIARIDRSLRASLATARELRGIWDDAREQGAAQIGEAAMNRLMNDVTGGIMDIEAALKRRRARIAGRAEYLQDLRAGQIGRSGVNAWQDMLDRCDALDDACVAAGETLQAMRGRIHSEYSAIRQTA